MNNDRTTNGDVDANNEPGLTEKNSDTVRGEEQLAEDTSFEDSNIEHLDDDSAFEHLGGRQHMRVGIVDAKPVLHARSPPAFPKLLG